MYTNTQWVWGDLSIWKPSTPIPIRNGLGGACPFENHPPLWKIHCKSAAEGRWFTNGWTFSAAPFQIYSPSMPPLDLSFSCPGLCSDKVAATDEGLSTILPILSESSASMQHVDWLFNCLSKFITRPEKKKNTCNESKLLHSQPNPFPVSWTGLFARIRQNTKIQPLTGIFSGLPGPVLGIPNGQGCPTRLQMEHMMWAWALWMMNSYMLIMPAMHFYLIPTLVKKALNQWNEKQESLYSLIAFDEYACTYVALFARRLAYKHYAITHTYNAANSSDLVHWSQKVTLSSKAIGV